MSGVSVQERVLAAAGAAVASRAPRVDVARELVDDLRAAIPYEAMQVALVDPFSGAHCTLVNAGYSERIVAYTDNEYTLRDIGFGELVKARVPMRMRDTSFDYRSSYSYVNYWGPEGYGDGITAPLFGADGRYVGFANISTADEDVLTDGVRDFIGLLAGVLGAAVDPLADVDDWLAETPSAHRMIVRADGSIARHAPEGSAWMCGVDDAVVVRAATAFLGSPQPARNGLVVDPEGRLIQVSMLQTRAPRLTGDPVVLATLRPAGQPFGLTQRETVVLRHLVDGGSNREIADELGIAPRTIATHVEHLLHKLGVETRTGAAACALEHGLLRLDV